MPCFEERLDADYWSPSELVRSFTAEVGDWEPTDRALRVFAGKGSGITRDETHRQRIRIAAGCMGSKPIAAVVFLLSAAASLWGRSWQAIRLDFRKIDLRDTGGSVYLLFRTAKNLYHGTNHIATGEHCNWRAVGDGLFWLILSAYVIRRWPACH